MSKATLALVVLACVAAVCLAQADKYPAGVNPATCPNYPYCHNAGHAAPVAYVAPALAAPHGQAARYPAGVNPATCPNYPYCNTAGVGAPAGYSFDRYNHQYPAGVHPAACPNYPYC